eukprot:gene1882-1148_t
MITHLHRITSTLESMSSRMNAVETQLSVVATQPSGVARQPTVPLVEDTTHAAQEAPVSDKIGAGAPIVIDGCKDWWANVGLALRSVLPLDERCPLVMLGGDAPRSLEVARFLPNLLFCFRPAPVEWNNCFSDEIRSVQLEDRQMHAKLVSRMSDSPVAPLDPFQEEDPDEDETDSVLEVARMMQHTSTTPAATPRSESDLESRVTAMEDVLREIQQYMRRTTATVAAPIVAETSVAPTTVSPPVADGISPVKTAGTSLKTQLEPLNRFEKLVTLQKGLNPLNIGADSPGLTNEFDSLFNLVETAASCNWIELGLPQFLLFNCKQFFFCGGEGGPWGCRSGS